MNDMGHNSDIHPQTAGRLKSIIERIERLEAEIKELNADKAEVYSEAKVEGFDTKIIKRVVAIRRLDASEHIEQETLVETYLAAVGLKP